MRPTQVTATGIKTGGFSLELAPVTLVTGDNGKGKTAIPDALKIALLGYHPNLGKRPGEILKLANGDVLEVDVELDGAKVTKTFKRKGKGGSLTEDGVTSLPKFPPVILDFDAFLHAKPTARREILESVLPPVDEAATLREIEDKLSAFPKLDLEAKTFVELVEAAGESGKEWKQESARLKGSVQSIEIKLAETTSPGSETIDVEKLRAERDVVLKNQTTVIDRIVNVAEKLKTAPAKPDRPRPTDEKIDELQKFVDAEKELIEKNQKIALANAEARRLIREIELAPETEGVAKLKSELGEVQREIHSDKRDLLALKTRIKDQEDEIAKVSALGECPTCRAKAEVALEAITAALQPRIDELSKQADGMEDRIGNLEKRQALVEDAISEAISADKLKRIEKTDDLRKTIVETSPDRLDEFERDLDELTELRLAWEKFEAAEIPSEEERNRLQSDAEKLAKVLAEIDGKIAEAAQNEKARSLLATLRGNLAEAKEELEAAEKRIKEAKSVGDWAKTRSLEVTAERLVPLLDPANSILSGVIEGSLSIEGTDVGVQVGESFRPIEVLSGAETAAVAAGIQVALASNSDLPFVILDELSKLRFERKNSLVRNLVAAVDSKLIEGVLILDHDEAFVGSFEGTSIKVHRVA